MLPDNKRTRDYYLRAIVISVLFSAAFWFVDSLIDSILTPGHSFMEEAFSPSPREIWIRFFVFLMAMVFSITFVSIYTRNFREHELLLDETRKSEEKYRDLFENASDAIFVLDTSFNYLDANRAAEEMLGFTKEELLELNVFDLIPQDQAASSLRELDELEHAGGYKNFIGRLRTKDRMWLDVEVSSSAMVKDGRIVGSRDIVRDITERKIIETALKRSLKEKDTLVKEIHHRVKNNLSVVQGLLQLQSSDIEDPKSRRALKESQERIASIGLIHSMLTYADDVKNMDMAKYITRLAERLIESYKSEDSDIQLKVDVDRIYIDIELMMPCGLILSELITNALKYAFPSRTSGRLSIFFRQAEDNYIVFGVRDNGVGLPEDVNLSKLGSVDELGSMGRKILITLTEQLGGRIEVSRNSGTEVMVIFRMQQSSAMNFQPDQHGNN